MVRHCSKVGHLGGGGPFPGPKPTHHYPLQSNGPKPRGVHENVNCGLNKFNFVFVRACVRARARVLHVSQNGGNLAMAHWQAELTTPRGEGGLRVPGVPRQTAPPSPCLASAGAIWTSGAGMPSPTPSRSGYAPPPPPDGVGSGRLGGPASSTGRHSPAFPARMAKICAFGEQVTEIPCSQTD